MSVKVSICIPTYKRPEEAVRAVESCMAQNHRPLEILVGDDSPDGRTERALAAVAAPEDVEVIYTRHEPRKGQGANVRHLFEQATGDRLLLLHDDDTLLPGGLDALVEALDRHPNVTCAYGTQVVVSPAGDPHPELTASVNSDYHRTPERTGVQDSSLAAGLLQQIPNNAFLVDANLARDVGYGSETEVGTGVDADFGLRLGEAAPRESFLLIDTPVSTYQHSEESVGRTGYGQRRYLLYEKVRQVDVQTEGEAAARALTLERLAPQSALLAALDGQRRLAAGIVRTHPRLFRPQRLGSIMVAVAIVSPSVARAVLRRRDAARA